MNNETVADLCARLEALAAKATPGPWQFGWSDRAGAVFMAPEGDEMIAYAGSGPGPVGDAHYLAALDPATVRRLLTIVRAGEALAEAVPEAANHLDMGAPDPPCERHERLHAALAAWKEASRG